MAQHATPTGEAQKLPWTLHPQGTDYEFERGLIGISPEQREITNSWALKHLSIDLLVK